MIDPTRPELVDRGKPGNRDKRKDLCGQTTACAANKDQEQDRQSEQDEAGISERCKDFSACLIGEWRRREFQPADQEVRDT